MGSVGNQNPWAPYNNNYIDCSQGICSIYCPQFCYFFFPPPPSSSNDDSTPLSPLIIAIIGVLASAFLLVSYYTIVTRYCKRSRSNDHNNTTSVENEEINIYEEIAHDQSSGLDESLIKTIAVCKYKKGDGLIEGSECAVCLGEFGENESLRLLPKCSHAFHLPCIDTWLKSRSNCPLCRTNVVVLAHDPMMPQHSDQALNMDSYESQRAVDLILVVDDDIDQDQRNICGEQVVLSLIDGNNNEGVKRFRRSISLGMYPFQRQPLISNVVKIEESDEDLVRLLQKDQSIGSSKGYVRSHVAMKRSISTGGLMYTLHGRGNNYLLPI